MSDFEWILSPVKPRIWGKQRKERNGKERKRWVKGKLCSVTVAAGLSKAYGVYLRIMVSSYELGCPDG